MNRYDKETTIIRDFQTFSIFKTLLLPINLHTFLIYRSIHNKKKWQKWIDSSAKDKLPPDFYNDKLKIMMDVMRVDDHAFVDKNGNIQNPYNKRESELIKELIKLNPNLKKEFDAGNLLLIPSTGLKSEDDHNYSFYINNFKRVINKHIKKIEKYKYNHQGYKTIFFVADETTAYIRRVNGRESPRVAGQLARVEKHIWWIDENMLNILKGSGIDYLVWMAPFKNINAKRKIISLVINFPKIVIIDVKKIKYKKLIKYDQNEIESAEL